MQRFKHDRPRFYPDLDGEYVLYSDVERLQAEKEGLVWAVNKMLDFYRNSEDALPPSMRELEQALSATGEGK